MIALPRIPTKECASRVFLPCAFRPEVNPFASSYGVNNDPGNIWENAHSSLEYQRLLLQRQYSLNFWTKLGRIAPSMSQYLGSATRSKSSSYPGLPGEYPSPGGDSQTKFPRPSLCSAQLLNAARNSLQAGIPPDPRVLCNNTGE